MTLGEFKEKLVKAGGRQTLFSTPKGEVKGIVFAEHFVVVPHSGSISLYGCPVDEQLSVYLPRFIGKYKYNYLGTLLQMCLDKIESKRRY